MKRLSLVCLLSTIVILELINTRIHPANDSTDWLEAKEYRMDIQQDASDVALAMGIEPPRVIISGGMDTLSIIFADENLIIVPRLVVAGLDRDIVKSLLAHELGHIYHRSLVLEAFHKASTSYVGFLGLWLGFLRGRTLVIIIGISLVYIFMATFKRNYLGNLFLIATSLGAILPSLWAYIARQRCNEYLADEIAAKHVGATTFAHGLQVINNRLQSVEPSQDANVSLFNRPRQWMAHHPPISARIRRLGVDPEEI
ncbi:Zn-dependent protease with chaperone function [Halorhabdus sp. BNX81]|nr:Zn-dependent protease with chaperone function [Halorhabdus sp. BNX81]